MPQNQNISLQFISTGTVKIRPAMRSQPADRTVVGRLFRSFTDRQWSDPLPIGVFLVSHPDGPVLFDTGESPLCNAPGFYPRYSLTPFLSQTTIEKEEGIVEQLRKLGVAPGDLQAIVLSRLHGDHAGGLKALLDETSGKVPVYVSPRHWDAYGKHPLYASLQGCLPSHWPVDFSPRLLLFTNEIPVGPWKEAGKITADGRILAVETPGHVPGHVSLVVYGDNEDGTRTTYFLTGDATYGIDLLDKEEPDGINNDPQTALQSIRMIKELARQTDLIVLPSHDNDTPKLLRDRIPYREREGAVDVEVEREESEA